MRILIGLVVIAAVAALVHLLREEPAEPAAPRHASGEVPPVASVPVRFDLVRLSREGMGVIAGMAAADSFVDVMEAGRSIGKSRASAAGAWEVVVEEALAPGTHVLSLTATDEQGGEARSTDIAIVSVPPPAGQVPTGTLKTAKGEKKPVVEDGVLAIVLPRDGASPGRVLQRPGQFRPALGLGVDMADFDPAGRTLLAGYASPGNTVNVFLDGRPVGTVKADDKGYWNIGLPPVGPGAHNIRLEEINPGNAVVLTVVQPFDPATAVTAPPDGKSAVVARDKDVWHVARRQGDGIRYSQVFRIDQDPADKDDDIKVPGILKPGSSI